MSNTAEARLGELDAALDAQQVTPQLAEELFAVVDVLDQQPALRRALTDPGLEPDARGAVIDALFGQRISPATVQVLREAAGKRWGSASGLAAALERQGVRAVFINAQQSSTLEQVEDELFRFSRVVDADGALRAALADRSASLTARRDLVGDLLTGKADAATVYLARRAVAARTRSFELTMRGYLTLAAAQRDRAVARVVVASPLTGEQYERLTGVLGRQLGRAVSLQVVVDPTIVGGVRVTVGDEIIDGTVSGRLEHARRQLS